MMKKINLAFVTLVLLVIFPADYSSGQFIPNAPFKAAYVYAPDFTLKDMEGKVFQLSKQRGKPVVIFFGTTWCPSCRSELPVYKEIYDVYTRKGMEVTYVNIMESREKVAKFVKANSLPFRILLDESGAVAESYAVIGVPTLVLIDKDGKFIKITHSTAELPLKKLFPVK
jgi:peroxiredoxin